MHLRPGEHRDGGARGRGGDDSESCALHQSRQRAFVIEVSETGHVRVERCSDAVVHALPDATCIGGSYWCPDQHVAAGPQAPANLRQEARWVWQVLDKEDGEDASE